MDIASCGEESGNALMDEAVESAAHTADEPAVAERDGVDVVVASEVVALGNPASIRSRFGLSRIARGLPGWETKHAFGRRARNTRCFQRDFD